MTTSDPRVVSDDPKLQAFYDDLFQGIDFWEIYFEIWRCLNTYGEWPVDRAGNDQDGSS
jgi:hypothetical protein